MNIIGISLVYHMMRYLMGLYQLIYLGKIRYFTKRSLAAIKGDSPKINHDSRLRENRLRS